MPRKQSQCPSWGCRPFDLLYFSPRLAVAAGSDFFFFFRGGLHHPLARAISREWLRVVAVRRVKSFAFLLVFLWALCVVFLAAGCFAAPTPLSPPPLRHPSKLISHPPLPPSPRLAQQVIQCGDNSGAKNLYIMAVTLWGTRQNRLPAACVGDFCLGSVKKGKPELRKKG